MTDIYINIHERAPITEEARTIACEIIEFARHGLDDDVPGNIPGLTASEGLLRNLRTIDRERQEQHGIDGSMYFGTTRKPYSFMYDAIRRGYNPSPDQVEAGIRGGGDFLWDEIMQLNHEHPDVYAALCENDSPRIGGYVVAEDVLEDVLGVLYMRGRDYREFGWGFPWWSDHVAPSSGAEAMK